MRAWIRQNRDLRIDFFRGIALWSMFIDHLIKGWLRAITVKEYAFSDSAELFVLLSGISAGIVYAKVLARDGIGHAWAKMLRRVLAIYRTHLLMFVFFVAEASVLIAWLHPPSLFQTLNLERLGSQPYQSFVDVVIFRYQCKFFDILPLYVLLLLILGIALPLTRWPRLLLALSTLLYVLTRAVNLHVPGWQGLFNPLAWQIIYIAGAVSGSILTAKRYWRGWDWLAAMFAVFSLFESHARHLAGFVPSSILIHFEADKPDLHPFRLLAILSLAWLAWRHLPATGRWIQSRVAAPFVLLGQHSLPVFAATLLLALFGEVLLEKNSGLIWQLVVQGLGSLALVGVGMVAAWNGRPSLRVAAKISALEPEQASVLVA